MGKEALTKAPRLLDDIIPSFVGSSSGGTLSFAPAPANSFGLEGWRILDINESSAEAFVWKGYIDLAGYELEQLTFFLQGTNISENQGFSGLGHVIHVSDLITVTPISDANLNLPYYTNQVHYAPGFGYSVHNMEEVIMGRHRTFYHDQGWTLDDLQQLSSQQQWGEADSTAADRIYITRIVTCADEEALLTVPNACVQVMGSAMEEPDLEYIMRLKRSYELAETVD